MMGYYLAELNFKKESDPSLMRDAYTGKKSWVQEGYILTLIAHNLKNETRQLAIHIDKDFNPDDVCGALNDCIKVFKSIKD